jgi:glycosyltransferase involved in cell wall biosynthesis
VAVPEAGPRNVTILIDSLLGGGAERVAVEAALALDSDRYIPHLLVTRHTGPLEERLAVAGASYTILDRTGSFGPRLFGRARRVVRGTDLLHAHKFEGSMWGSLLARSARRPLVTHEHTFTGASSLRRTIGYRAMIAPSATRIICVSEGVAASLRADGIRPDKLEVIPNGVPIDVALERDAARAELGLDTRRAVIGIVARLRPEKRHELALEALASLRTQGEDVVLCAVGDGPRLAELRSMSEELGVADAVVWAGELSSAQRLLGAFDVLLLCSSYEGMPLAALEALVAGVPIVSTAVGAMPELLADGSGTIVDDEPGAIAAAIRATLERSAAGDGSDDARRERLRRAYGIDRVARDLQRIYDEVLGAA